MSRYRMGIERGERMIDTDEYEEDGEGKMITITGIVSELYFEELMDGRECFHDVEWDVQDYDTYEPLLLEEIKRLRDLHILACDYLQSISDGTLPDSEWPHIHAMIRGEEE